VNDRSYLSIGEVLALLQEEFPDVTISKIRFLESQGLIDPERTPSGYRKFYATDIDRLRFILREQKDRFLPLKVIKDRLESGEVIDEPGPVMEPEAASTERVPIWMAKAAEKAPAPPASVVGSLATGVNLTFEELCTATGLSPEELREVEQYGLVAGKPLGRTVYYDEDALAAGRLAAGFMRFGLEPRHLRMYRTAAEREAGLFEQVILPLVKQRNPQARAEAVDRLRDLRRLGHELRDAMLRQALKPYTEGS